MKGKVASCNTRNMVTINCLISFELFSCCLRRRTISYISLYDMEGLTQCSNMYGSTELHNDIERKEEKLYLAHSSHIAHVARHTKREISYPGLFSLPESGFDPTSPDSLSAWCLFQLNASLLEWGLGMDVKFLYAIVFELLHKINLRIYTLDLSIFKNSKDHSRHMNIIAYNFAEPLSEIILQATKLVFGHESIAQ